MPLAGILHHTPHPLWDSRRLWSLWEMINFCLLDFEIAMRTLETAIKLARDKPVGAFINNLENEWYRSIFDLVDAKVIAPLKIEETKLTAARLGFLFEKDAAHSHSEAADLLQRLRDEIRAGSSNHFFFHYPKELAALLSSIKDDWADAIAVLPELEREIQAGVDCYAMGDYPGCVFHMMRIAEAGLREIARDVGVKSLNAKRGETKPIEWGTWDEVFTAINNKREEASKSSQGPKRDRLFIYYDTAIAELKWMRGLYRDPTMHFRETYGRGEAFDSIGRARNLVTTIAKKRKRNARKRGN